MKLEYHKEESIIASRLETAHDPEVAKVRADFFNAENDFFSRTISDQRVLVAGSGLGHDAVELAKHNREVVGVELLENLIVSSQTKLKEFGLHNLRIVRGDITELPFPDGSFDATVLNMGTIGNFDDKIKALGELLRVAHKVYFDFYPPTSSGLERRKRMYEEEGWTNVRIDDEALVSDDGLYSTSTTTKEIEEVAHTLGASVVFHDITDFAVMAELTK